MPLTRGYGQLCGRRDALRREAGDVDGYMVVVLFLGGKTQEGTTMERESLSGHLSRERTVIRRLGATAERLGTIQAAKCALGRLDPAAIDKLLDQRPMGGLHDTP